jgi:UDP-xylose/UDP-N-acetylglucosamine transporter B4
MSTPVNLLAIPTPAGLPETRFLAGTGTKDTLIQWRQLMIPSALGALLLNVITQGMCVRGVNRLTTVSILFSLSHEADGWRESIQPLSTWS